MTLEATRKRAARRFGWTSLLGWALFGLGLETMHGWKIGAYLDDAIAREVLVLAHAHGVGLSLVVLAFAEAGTPLFGAERDGGASASLRVGAFLVPAGFALSALHHAEGDPGIAIALVPVGALLALYAIGRTALAAWRA